MEVSSFHDSGDQWDSTLTVWFFFMISSYDRTAGFSWILDQLNQAASTKLNHILLETVYSFHGCIEQIEKLNDKVSKNKF